MEDYLWDKSGDDADIARIENALAAFRYQETAPPVPAQSEQKVFTLEKQPARSFFRFFFPAFAGFAALVVIVSVSWLQFSGSKRPAAETVSGMNVVHRAQKTAGESFIAPRETSVPVAPSDTVKTFEERKSFIAPQVVKIRRTVAPVARRHEKTVAHNKKRVEPAEPLTKEEQYAYDQLMLALTITGSKLKIVQDKINRIEEQSAVVSGQ